MLAAMLRGRVRWLPWGLVLAIAAVLRLWQLPEQLLADDEWHALNKLVSSGFAGIASSFGFADHTIPLTLYYKLLSLGPGLDEWSMRLPLLLAGLASVAAMPWLLRGWARADEKAILALLIALSPLLVYFSRTARPYALSVLLAFAALMAFRHWWISGDRRWALGYVFCCAAAAWLHPLTLAATLAPFPYQGAQAVWSGVRRRDWSGLVHVSVLLAVTLIPLALLLGPPLWADYHSLAGKAGADRVTPVTAWRAIELFAGSSGPVLVAAWLGLAALGAGLLARREPGLAGYLAFVTMVSTGLVVLSGGAWIHHPLVLARYLLPLLPILLFFVAVALAAGLRALPSPAHPWAVIGVGLLLYFAGPLPAQYRGAINQFTGHMSYQFDYRSERNVYNRKLRPTPVPDFYRELAAEPPGTLTLIQAPWYIEWHWNNWHFQQAVHRQRVLAGFVSGLCADHAYGEYPPDVSGVRLRHALHLSSVEPGDPRADFLVLHRVPAQPGAREIPGLEDCVERLREKLGPAYRDDQDVVVFDLRDRRPESADR